MPYFVPYADRAQQNEYQRKRLAERRVAWLRDNGPCSCGATENLEVDHRDPALKVDHKVWSWSEQRRAAELAKCQVLCIECHKVKTRSEFSREREHGTALKYKSDGCRCEACRVAQANSQAEWRQRTGRH